MSPSPFLSRKEGRWGECIHERERERNEAEHFFLLHFAMCWCIGVVCFTFAVHFRPRFFHFCRPFLSFCLSSFPSHLSFFLSLSFFTRRWSTCPFSHFLSHSCLSSYYITVHTSPFQHSSVLSHTHTSSSSKRRILINTGSGKEHRKKNWTLSQRTGFVLARTKGQPPAFLLTQSSRELHVFLSYYSVDQGIAWHRADVRPHSFLLHLSQSRDLVLKTIERTGQERLSPCPFFLYFFAFSFIGGKR